MEVTPVGDAKGTAERMTVNKGALAILVHGGSENWSPRRWKARFDEVCPDRRVLLLPDASFDPAEVHYAAVWKPNPGELAAFPNLRVIFNLGAGVDALMADRSLPDVPFFPFRYFSISGPVSSLCTSSTAGPVTRIPPARSCTCENA